MGLGEQNKDGGREGGRELGRGYKRKLSLFHKCLVMTLVYFPKKNAKKKKLKSHKKN